MLLADYALHHISIETFLTGETGEQQDVGKDKNQEELNGREEKEDEQGTVSAIENAGAMVDSKCNGGRAAVKTEKMKTRRGMLREKVLGIVRESVGVEPHVVMERLGVRLPKVSQVAGELEMDGLIKVTRNIPDLKNLNRPNVTLYLDAERPTALHDTVMNLVWEKNIALGGRSRNYAFKHAGKTWCSDGLLENAGGLFMLEVVTGDYEERMVEQIQAYATQVKVSNMGIKGVIVVFLSRSCLQRARVKVADRGLSLGDGLLTTLRSRDEKLQFENLLLRGRAATYHKNLTSC